MQLAEDLDLYLKVQDKHGAIATIYFSPQKTHRVIYHDSNGQRFYREEFAETPIEVVERSVMDWAEGKRGLL